MQVQMDISFDQLLKAVKELPSSQLKKLRAELDKEVEIEKASSDLEMLLLNGPVATTEQLQLIESNRMAINQWRTKV